MGNWLGIYSIDSSVTVEKLSIAVNICFEMYLSVEMPIKYAVNAESVSEPKK